jgi:hypothetical protein
LLHWQRHNVGVLIHFYQTQFPIQAVRSFHDWDRSPTPFLCITSAFAPGTAVKAVARAISRDSDIEELLLDKFATDVLPVFISTLFEESRYLILISFENYADPFRGTFVLKAREDSKVSSLVFRAVHASFSTSFFASLAPFAGRIQSLTCAMLSTPADVLGDVCQKVSSLPCFSKVSKLTFQRVVV